MAPLLRRLRHRMQLRRLESLAGYVELLRAEPEEAHALKRDLLLHVTEFFQDSALYQLLEERLLPDIFARQPKRVRIWSIGCATGEEAYSLAMLLIEQSERFRTAAEVQVFASDLSDDALRRARFGLYPHEIAGSISSARLEGVGVVVLGPVCSVAEQWPFSMPAPMSTLPCWTSISAMRVSFQFAMRCARVMCVSCSLLGTAWKTSRSPTAMSRGARSR